MIVTAYEHQAMGAPSPELHLLIEDPEVPLRSGDPRQYDYMGYLLSNATFKVIGESGTLLHLCGQAGDDVLFHCRSVQPKVGGRHSIKTTQGVVTYDYFSWYEQFTYCDSIPLLSGYFRYKGMGNIQYGQLNLKVLLEAAKDLPFTFTSQTKRFHYSGPVARRADTYKAASYPTYGTRYYTRTHPGAHEVEVCGGFFFPDEEAAKAACTHFVETGEQQTCWGIKDLEARFPDHPVLPTVRRLLAQQKKSP